MAQTNLEDVPYPFYDKQTGLLNEMTVINRGELALQKRIDLIRKATQSIEVEYFIFKTDMSGKIIARELVEAAKRGVKVRILVDKLMAELTSYHAKELDKHGIELKYYNTSFILKISSIHYRNHRKLLVIDDSEAITGGRNIGNDYYNLDRKYNYEDRDVLIKGPIVKTMRESFDAYFSDKLAHKVSFPKLRRGPKGGHPSSRGGFDNEVHYKRWTKRAQNFLVETEEEIQVREQIAKVAAFQQLKLNTHICPETTFTTDAPGGGFIPAHSDGYLEKYRHVMKALDEKMATAREITISTPYFIANKRNKKLLDDLLERDATVNLYTNSLKAADAIYMATGFYMKLKGWLKKGMKVFLHDGTASEDEVILQEARNSRWGTHAKTQVYERENETEVMIGTYNMDNRSDYYNNEMVVFCKGNDDLSIEVKNDIMENARNGITIDSDRHGTNRDGNRVNILGTSNIHKLKMDLALIPTWLLEHLL